VRQRGVGDARALLAYARFAGRIPGADAHLKAGPATAWAGFLVFVSEFSICHGC